MYVLLAINPGTREMGWAVFCGETTPDQVVRLDEASTGMAQRGPGQGPGNGAAHPLWRIMETGVIVAHQRPRMLDVSQRIKAMETELDRMAKLWHPAEVACGKPYGLQLPDPQQRVEMLTDTLEAWAGTHLLSLHSYSFKKIRDAISGRGGGTREELTYAVMTRWGLLGEEKTTSEWSAIAVGDYHLGHVPKADEVLV